MSEECSLHSEGCEALASAPYRSCGCPIPGAVQSQNTPCIWAAIFIYCLLKKFQRRRLGGRDPVLALKEPRAAGEAARRQAPRGGPHRPLPRGRPPLARRGLAAGGAGGAAQRHRTQSEPPGGRRGTGRGRPGWLRCRAAARPWPFPAPPSHTHAS